MGGPGAWRKMQQKNGEWLSQGFDDPYAAKQDHEDGGGDDTEKGDLYTEYDIECKEKEEEDRGDIANDNEVCA